MIVLFQEQESLQKGVLQKPAPKNNADDYKDKL